MRLGDCSSILAARYVMVALNAPLDESGGGPGINVPLYQLSRSDPEWAIIMAEFNYNCPMSPPPDCDCIKFIYCRGVHRDPPNSDRDLIYHGASISALPIMASDVTQDSEPSSPDDYGPTGTLPNLYVSSDDTHGGQQPDAHDYARARCTKINDPVNDVFEEYWSSHMHYGFNRGFYDIDGCPGAVSQSGCPETSAILASETQEDYKGNILTFGQEYIIASICGVRAQYAVQSEADILFVMAHGNVIQDESFMGPFRVNPTDPPGYDPVPIDPITRGYFIWASDWEGNSLIGRDAKWLVSTSCMLLAPRAVGRWQQLVVDHKLKSVMGWKQASPATQVRADFTISLVPIWKAITRESHPIG